MGTGNGQFLSVSLTPAATHMVQDLRVEVQGNALVVECMFAVGVSPNSTCTVIVEGEGSQQWNKTFRGNHTFSDLPSGSYTVRAWDKQSHLDRDAAAEKQDKIEPQAHDPEDSKCSFNQSPLVFDTNFMSLQAVH